MFQRWVRQDADEEGVTYQYNLYYNPLSVERHVAVTGDVLYVANTGLSQSHEYTHESVLRL